MKNEDKILRNWKIVWTGLAIVLSIFVFNLGVKYNFVFCDDIGWNQFDFKIERNGIDYINLIQISGGGASGIPFHMGAGLFGFLVIQLLNIPIWVARHYLVR